MAGPALQVKTGEVRKHVNSGWAARSCYGNQWSSRNLLRPSMLQAALMGVRIDMNDFADRHLRPSRASIRYM